MSDCNNCGERMIGDGVGTVIHCPYAEWEDHCYHEPDARPVHCTREEPPEGEWMQTCGGEKIYPAIPDFCKLTIADIAASLAKVNRFGGHTTEPYSVAQHSVWVCDRVWEATGSIKVARVALMHDATEAYLGDMVRPVKSLLPDYKALEAKFWAAICQQHDLPEQPHPAVKYWDNVACAVERRDLQCDPLPSPLEEIPGVREARELQPTIKPLGWLQAEGLFIARCYQFQLLLP